MGKYQDYLQSEHWQKTRHEKQKSVRSGAKHLCEECRIYFPIRFMHTHHKHYKTKGSEQLSDLQALCKWCHAAKHGKTVVADKSKVLCTLVRDTMTDGEMNELRNSFISKLKELEQ